MVIGLQKKKKKKTINYSYKKFFKKINNFLIYFQKIQCHILNKNYKFNQLQRNYERANHKIQQSAK